MKYTVVFKAAFITTIEVDDKSELSDALSDIEIPETPLVQYDVDSYKVISVVDETGREIEDFNA